MSKPIKDLKRMPAGFKIEYEPFNSSVKKLYYHGALIARINPIGYLAIETIGRTRIYCYNTWQYSCKDILSIWRR